MSVKWKSVVGAGLVQGAQAGQGREEVAPVGSWEGAGRAHEADSTAFWVHVDLPSDVGTCRTIRVERVLFTPGCGAWTLS